MAANMGADGKLYKSSAFVSLMKYKNSKYKPTDQDIINISKLEYTNIEDITDVDNPDKYEWYEIGNSKYGRYMYCPKTNTKRTQTIGEFYQNSTVD